MDAAQSRVFCAEQITVPTELPEVMKAYTKALLKDNPVQEGETGAAARQRIYEWSLAYFKKKEAEAKN